VWRWWKAYRKGGEAALRARPPAGRRSKLTDAQKQNLRRRLLEGARANGFATDLWTCPRIAQLIRRLWGVSYHVDSLPRFLRAMGFSCQRPQKRAVERDEEAVASWVAHQWPRIKKKPRA
jgi:transposase